MPNDSGTLITMKCRCKAKPAPTVTWYRGADIVKDSARFVIRSQPSQVDGEEDIYELTLEIKVSGS